VIGQVGALWTSAVRPASGREEAISAGECNVAAGVARRTGITVSSPERAMSLFSTTRVPVDVLGRSRRRGLSRRALLDGRLLPARLARQTTEKPQAAFGDDRARAAAIVAQRQRVAVSLRAPRWF
jgi:hypothetical protein